LIKIRTLLTQVKDLPILNSGLKLARPLEAGKPLKKKPAALLPRPKKWLNCSCKFFKKQTTKINKCGSITEKKANPPGGFHFQLICALLRYSSAGDTANNMIAQVMEIQGGAHGKL